MDDSSDERPGSEPIFSITEDFKGSHLLVTGARRPTKKGDVVPHYLAALPISEARGWIPSLLRYELGFGPDGQPHTTYWVMHPMSPSLRRELPTAENRYRTTYFPVKPGYVEELNVIPLDLDVGRYEGDLTAGDAMRVLVDAWSAKKIPAPSWTALSGRGVYAIWRLRDPGGGLPRNNNANRLRWKEIQRRLMDIAKPLKLNPDPSMSNLVQFTKLPGTVDTLLVDGKETKSGNTVAYLPWLPSPSSKPPVYTLDELESFLGVEQLPDPPDTIDRPGAYALESEPRTSRTDGRTGAYVWKARAKEILDLCNYRRGMREGARHYTLFFYFGCVLYQYKALNPESTNAESFQWAREATHKLNRSFDPPVSERDVERAIERPNSGLKMRWKATTLAARMRVTDEEAEALSLDAIAPAHVRQQHRQDERDAKARAAAARKMLAHEVDELLLRHPTLGDLDIAREHGKASRAYVYQHRKKLLKEGKLKKAPSPVAVQVQMALLPVAK